MRFQFDPFTVEYEKFTHPILDFKTECVAAANQVKNKNTQNLPVAVMMSGGIDSELVAESLKLAKIPFFCVIGRLQAELATEKIIFNDHDYQFAINWCQKNSIEYTFCDIDIYKHANILTQLAISANGFSPQYACHMYVMKWCKSKGYFFVAGNGEMDFVFKDGRYYMLEEQREFTLEIFRVKNKIPGIVQFWKQDARCISAFLRLPTVQKYIEKQVPKLLDYKYECFSHEFDLEPRPKRTGFENIQDWDGILRNSMRKVNGKFDEKYFIPIEFFLGDSNVLG